MSRTKRDAAPTGPETPAQRLAHCMKTSGGTMPMTLVFKDAADADQARKLLAAKNGKWKKLITVKLEEGAK